MTCFGWIDLLHCSLYQLLSFYDCRKKYSFSDAYIHISNVELTDTDVENFQKFKGSEQPHLSSVHSPGMI